MKYHQWLMHHKSQQHFVLRQNSKCLDVLILSKIGAAIKINPDCYFRHRVILYQVFIKKL